MKWTVGPCIQRTIAIVSPPPTESPTFARISATVPERPAAMLFSIFMASTHGHRLTGLHLVAHVHQQLDDRALHRDGDLSGAAAETRWPAGPSV